MELGAQDRSAFAGRTTAVDYDGLKQLHYLGSYVRQLPVSLTRMMENAYDWEHLPFVHSSSFAAIGLIEEGDWGWRCKTDLPNGAGNQLVELLVDRPNHYWATTVVEGSGQGIQIHTQASEQNDGIEVDVRFYVPAAPETEAQAAMILSVMQTQYAQLYDEDAELMQGRQAALDTKRERRAETNERVDLGKVSALDIAQTYTAELPAGAFVVRYWSNGWIAHAATCPHMLGPLAEAGIDSDGRITCPWHGYRFAVSDGVEAQKRCGALPLAACKVDERGHLMVSA